MTKDKILTALLSYVETLPEDDRALVRKYVDKDQRLYDIPGLPQLINLIVDIKDDVRAEAAKSSGKADVLKAMKSVIKSAEKTASHNPMFHGAFYEDGKQCVCDGYRAIRVDNPVDIHIAEQGDRSFITKTFREVAKAEELALPSVADLKAYIKINTAAKKATSRNVNPLEYDFGEGLPAVNAQYLLDMLTAMPDATAYWDAKNTNSIIYFKAEGVDGILCPVKKQKAA